MRDWRVVSRGVNGIIPGDVEMDVVTESSEEVDREEEELRCQVGGAPPYLYFSILMISFRDCLRRDKTLT